MAYFQTRNFEYEVAIGNVAGTFNRGMAGNNPSFNPEEFDKENLWNVGGLYKHQTEEKVWELSSSDALDKSLVLAGVGINDAGDRVTAIAVLNATDARTKVTFSVALLTIEQLFIVSTGGANIGDIYVYPPGTAITNGVPDLDQDALIKMDAGTSSAVNGTNKIPKGFIGYVHQVEITTGENKNNQIRIEIRLDGQPNFLIPDAFNIASTNLSFLNKIGFAVPELTDLQFTGSSDDPIASMGFSARILLREL